MITKKLFDKLLNNDFTRKEVQALELTKQDREKLYNNTFDNFIDALLANASEDKVDFYVIDKDNREEFYNNCKEEYESEYEVDPGDFIIKYVGGDQDGIFFMIYYDSIDKIYKIYILDTTKDNSSHNAFMYEIYEYIATNFVIIKKNQGLTVKIIPDEEEEQDIIISNIFRTTKEIFITKLKNELKNKKFTEINNLNLF